MKFIVKTISVAAILCLTVGCTEKSTYCNCWDKYDHLDSPYTPPEYTISWTDFNSLRRVDEYFLYHDSTLRKHDGDTILLYGYISDNLFIYPGLIAVGKKGVLLQWHPDDEEANCGYCFHDLEVICPPDRPVEEWMTEKYRKVFVKGTIKCFRELPSSFNSDTNRLDLLYKIYAIQLDSVRF